MTESLIIVIEYDKICRLCLQSTSGMSDIFEENYENPLQRFIHRATGFKIESSDGLPSKICYRCRHLVELSCELRDMVDKTQAFLQSGMDVAPGAAKQIHVTEPEIIQDEDILSQPVYKTDKETSDKGNLDENENITVPDQQPIAETDNSFKDNNLDSKWNDTNGGPKTGISQTFKEFDTALTSKKKVSPKHLTCQICLSVFTNVEEVESHVKSHYKETILTPYTKLQRPFHCEECNNEAMSKTQLIVHHRRHLDINPFVCKETGCDFKGKNRDSLRHHNLKHGMRSQVCEICGAAYRRSFELRQHRIRAHDTGTAVQCQTCHGSFLNILSLRQHANICKKPHRYACEWTGCTKAYHSRAELAAHSRTHSGERAFRCHLCDVAAYTSKSMLNRHLSAHVRRRACSCERCGARFAEYGAYYSHRVAAHGAWLPYRCNRCNKGYQSEANLEKHLKTCESVTNLKTTRRTARMNNQSHVTTIEEIVATDDKGLELEGEMFEDLVNQLKVQPLLVQMGNIGNVSKDFVLQEVPSNGLLYVEVGAGAEKEQETRNNDWEQ